MIKTVDGIKVTTDHGEELMADVVLFATGKHNGDLQSFPNWQPVAIGAQYVHERILIPFIIGIFVIFFYPSLIE